MSTPIVKHQSELSNCTRCENMIGPSVICQPINASIMLVGQAPGDREPKLGRPFAWTAGKTLFKWFDSIGIEEELFRQNVYMAAVCRCFPGKNPKGGDRVPDKQEIANCQHWLKQEYQILQPKLIIPVGKLAIGQYLTTKKLVDVVGQQFVLDNNDLIHADCIPLPHPSGLSTWFRMEPGKSLLQDALGLIEKHPAWLELMAKDIRVT